MNNRLAQKNIPAGNHRYPILKESSVEKSLHTAIAGIYSTLKQNDLLHGRIYIDHYILNLATLLYDFSKDEYIRAARGVGAALNKVNKSLSLALSQAGSGETRKELSNLLEDIQRSREKDQAEENHDNPQTGLMILRRLFEASRVLSTEQKEQLLADIQHHISKQGQAHTPQGI